ncbi:MAG: DUF6677 family protein [Pirellulales bacterium]|nr:DUF6677 family protein [Pirellulales bacterium]
MANSDATERLLPLHNPALAALLAWLIPGAGHFYQRRWLKGSLYSFCILGTFLYGIMLPGTSRVVYASFRPGDIRLAYVGQVGMGLPTLPALVQYVRVQNKLAPWWGGFMAPPVLVGQEVPVEWAQEMMALGPEQGDFRPGDFVPSFSGQTMVFRGIYRGREYTADPALNDYATNQLSVWSGKYDYHYDLGWCFTAVAGLMNFLVVLDAYFGPAIGWNWILRKATWNPLTQVMKYEPLPVPAPVEKKSPSESKV